MIETLARQAQRFRAFRVDVDRQHPGTCPICRTVLQRSRSRSRLERLRKYFTTKRPYRCANCGWREWLAPMLVRGHLEYWVVKRDDPEHPFAEGPAGGNREDLDDLLADDSAVEGARSRSGTPTSR